MPLKHKIKRVTGTYYLINQGNWTNPTPPLFYRLSLKGMAAKAQEVSNKTGDNVALMFRGSEATTRYAVVIFTAKPQAAQEGGQ